MKYEECATEDYDDPINVDGSGANAEVQPKWPHLKFGWLILFPTGIMLVGRYIILKYVETRYGIPAIQTYAAALFMSLVVMSVYSACAHGIHSLSQAARGLFRPISILFMCCTGPAVVTLTLAYLWIGAGDACAIFVCAGPLGTFFSWFIYDDQGATSTEVFSLCLCIMGVICIVRPPALFHLLFGDLIKTDDPAYVVAPPEGYEFFNGYVLALISMLLVGIQSAIFPMYTKQNGKVASFIIADVGKTVCMGIFLYFTQDFSSLELFIQSIPWIFALVICNSAVNVGWGLASVLLPVSHQAIILSGDKIWAYIFGILLFQEVPYWLSIVGACEVWIAIITMGYSEENKKKSDSPKLALKETPAEDVEYASCTPSANHAAPSNPIVA